MTDPVLLLTSDSVEAPPEEIVLGAVRQFRYRSLVTILVGLAGVLALVLIAQRLQVGPIDDDLETLLLNRDATVSAIEGSHLVDGVEFRVTESIWADGVGYLRIIATETMPERAEPQLDVAIDNVSVEPGQQWSVNDVGGSLGRTPGARTTDAWWVRYESATPPSGSIFVSAFVIAFPADIVENGGAFEADIDPVRLEYQVILP